MKSFTLALVAALLVCGTAYAKSDAKMSCAELSAELERLDNIIAKEKGAATAANVGGAGTAVASHASMLGGQGGAATAANVGGAGTAVASHASMLGGQGANAIRAGAAIGGLFSMRKQHAEMNAQQAQERKTMLSGIYLGKGCDEAPQFAETPAAPAPAATAAVSTDATPVPAAVQSAAANPQQ